MMHLAADLVINVYQDSPPWYESQWFVAICTLVGIGGGAWVGIDLAFPDQSVIRRGLRKLFRRNK